MKNNSSNPKKLDPAVDGKVEALLLEMTLKEKIGQLVLENAFAPIDWNEVVRQQKLAEENGMTYEIPLPLNATIEEHVRKGQVGAFTSDSITVNNHLQRIAMEESRLHIPLLIGHDVIHGFRTVFPIPLAASCTWNPDLIERAASMAATEASSAGINLIYAPMVDIARDPRWGRIAEGAGEDPFLGMAMARAQVRGFQSADLPTGRRVSACPKHYVGYGAAEAGRDYNTVELSERTLRDIYLPPFKAAFDAGAGSTMSSFNEISGIPGSSNEFLLRTVLREEWNWHGPVVSDYNAVGELVPHGVAADLEQATRMSILAGVDIDMQSGGYARHLEQLVLDGKVPLGVLDEAVCRVLRLKFELGLFENLFTDEALSKQYVLTPDFRELALEVAKQSMILLKNENQILPLQKDDIKYALVGPLVDNRTDLLGTWSLTGNASDVDTVLAGFQKTIGGKNLFHAQGCAISGTDELDLSSAVAAARKADIVVLVIGESAGMSGEAHSRAHLGLPGKQQQLLDAMAATGKPLVVVVMCGRPLVVPRLVEQADALLVAWHGGIRAGQAVADLLFGITNPSGKLSASWPRAEGQIPVYYAHKSTGRPASGSGTMQFQDPFRSNYMDEPNEPLFAFGQGLSYSKFEYSQLQILTPSIPVNGTLEASAQVKNTSGRVGEEIVQLYVRDLVGTVTRPVKELKGFQRISLKPGEIRKVIFKIPASEMGFHGLDMHYRVEPGQFKLWIGTDSTQGLEGEFEIHS